MLKTIGKLLAEMGFRPLNLINYVRGTPSYIRDYFKLRYSIKNSDSVFRVTKFNPMLNDKYSSGGVANGHYFHQDLLVARKVFNNRPVRHIDIGSRVDGFVAHVAAFRKIEVWDIRIIEQTPHDIEFRQNNLSDGLTSDLLECTDSLSCLHVIEHFGLGRYGDPIDAMGHIKGLDNMTSMLKSGGVFYFGTPIGPQRIEYNAHRVFSVSYLMEYLNKKFELRSFSYVNDDGDLNADVEVTSENVKNSFGCYYGCGIFELVKR